MINRAEEILRESDAGRELKYKYIIIDEYQDIARQRFNLTKRLAEVCRAKIIAVGDDWQSIYAFSGSDITLFTQFIQLMGHGKMLRITKTYRNSQELIDIAGISYRKTKARSRNACSLQSISKTRWSSNCMTIRRKRCSIRQRP